MNKKAQMKFLILGLIVLLAVLIFVLAEPNQTINSPLNQTYPIGTTSIIFNITANDSDGIDQCLMSLDGTSNLTMYKDGAWNLSNYIYDSNITSSGFGIYFSSNGSNLYRVENALQRIYEYNCSTAWNISSCVQGNYISSTDSSPYNIFFKPDGTKLYEFGTSNNLIYEYNCSTAWDITTCSYNGNNLSSTSSYGFTFKSDGTKLYRPVYTTQTIYEDNCAIAWNVSSCTASTSSGLNDSTARNVFFRPDGLKFYEIGTGSNLIYQHDCSTAWNITSCSYNGINLSTSGEISVGLYIKSDGLKLYEGGNSHIYEYNMTLSSNDYTYTNSSMTEGSHNVTFYCNDTLGNINTTSQIFSILSDTTSPYWFNNQTNSTYAGQSINHSILWNDSIGLGGYIFSFDDGNGTFVNDSFVSFSGTNNFSNVIKTVNSTSGSTIRWTVYANDTSNNWNQTDIFNYTTTTYTPPVTPPSSGGGGGTTTADKLTNISIDYKNNWVIGEINEIKVISLNQINEKFKPNSITISGLDGCNLETNSSIYNNETKEYEFFIKSIKVNETLPKQCNITFNVIQDITIQETINIKIIERNLINNLLNNKETFFSKYKIEIGIGVIIIILLLILSLTIDFNRKKRNSKH